MRRHIQIKICGLTSPAQAVACAAAGADAIGFIFHPPSPRHLTIPKASEIASALPDHIARVGVFTTQDIGEIRETVEKVGLTVAQLHADASAEIIVNLLAEQLRVVVVLKNPEALIHDARKVPDEAGLLVECGKGILPGGNGAVWNWQQARPIADIRPFIVAGGVTPQNVAEALRASHASAVDVSSGVEVMPGEKSLSRVHALIEAVRAIKAEWNIKSVF